MEEDSADKLTHTIESFNPSQSIEKTQKLAIKVEDGDDMDIGIIRETLAEDDQLSATGRQHINLETDLPDIMIDLQNDSSSKQTPSK